MRRNARDNFYDDKPDIAFSTPTDNKFPSPQEFEEMVEKRGHLYYDKPRLSVGQIIVSVISILGIIAVLYFAVTQFIMLQPDEGLAGKYGTFAAKLVTLHDSIAADMESGDQELILKTVGIWAGLALIGLLAGSADLLLSRMPVDNFISYRFGFSVSPTLRFLPSVTVTVYMLFRFIVTQFDDTVDFNVTLTNFHLKGEGYTWGMWVTHGCYILVFFACIFAIYEAFANSGLFGIILRLPLSVLSNSAVIMLLLSGSVFIIAITIVFVLLKAIGIILGITMPDQVRYYKE